MGRKKFDVGLVVPLKEEFRYVQEITPQLESIAHEGTFFYRLDFEPISVVCCLMDQIGLLPALHATNRLLEFAEVKLVVLLGVGGALSNDVSVGDVVIASEVSEFQANSKAEPDGTGYKVRYSGRNWPLEFRIREAVSHFEFSSHDAFATWKANASGDYANLNVPGKESTCPPSPAMHFGPIASGNVVIASSAFAAEVKTINRKFVAIEMEAAGVAMAATERIHPLPYLVVRGISDNANENKATLDGQGNGSWRRYSARNAASLLRSLLRWEGLMDAVGLRIPATPTEHESTTVQLVTRLKSCVGGPWIVGAAFGIYPYGPRVLDAGNVVPMDLSRLRATDTRIGHLLEAAEKERETLLAGGPLEVAADRFAALIEEFRDQISSAGANLLLQDFDGVVTETLCPANDEDERLHSLLLECDRLEEDVGAEAVIDFLKGRPNVSAVPALRTRYMDALASAEKWGELAELTLALNYNELVRSELEHGLFACTRVGLFDHAKKMMRQHQIKYDDKAGKLIRRELVKQYPQIGEAIP
ncbi:MAG: 5'-methylthioadenosine/S-adenosylhomocysteine nucleosidase [Candidatus Acidiferrum sp.]